MPRQLRVECPGAVYRVMSRGDRKGAICLDHVDRLDFFKTLVELGEAAMRALAFNASHSSANQAAFVGKN
jgi:hypothetical protein